MKPVLILITIGLFIGPTMIGVNNIRDFFNGVGKDLKRVVVVENTQAVEEIKLSEKESRIASLINEIYFQAKRYGVNGYQMERTIECESRFNNIQSTAYKVIKDKKGRVIKRIREESYGLAQIYLPAHPEVTKAQALDEHFAIEWMAKHFNDPGVVWYGYIRKTDKCAGD